MHPTNDGARKVLDPDAPTVLQVLTDRRTDEDDLALGCVKVRL